jgi:polysaccharide pyruvyl transferase WcaK-like protein
LNAGENVILAPDIVLSPPAWLDGQVNSPRSTTDQREYVIVSLRHDANALGHDELSDERIRTLASSLDDLIDRRQVDVIFLPFQANPSNGCGDARLHERVVRTMRHTDHIQLRPWTIDLKEVSSWIQDARFVIAMRLHAAVLASSFGCPSVLMPCDQKLREYGDRMNLRRILEPAKLDQSLCGTSRAGRCLAGLRARARYRASPKCFRPLQDSLP